MFTAGLLLALAGCGTSTAAASTPTNPTVGPSTAAGAPPSPSTGTALTVPVTTILPASIAGSVLGGTATAVGCAPTSCNYVTAGGLGAMTIETDSGVTNAEFAGSHVSGFPAFTGVGSAAAYMLTRVGTGVVSWLVGTTQLEISVRIANGSTGIEPVTASQLKQLAAQANARI